MCTFQGEAHLLEQLESIRAQTHENWTLFVSDDGSTDGTLPILREFQASLPPGRMTIVAGPRQGFAANFLSLLLNPLADGDYFAFSDQDDVWYPDKVAVALSALQSLHNTSSRPCAYGAATVVVDDALKVLGVSRIFRPIPSFKNALAQNIAGGNTITLNRALRMVLLKIGHVKIVSHDWWVYLVCTGAGGEFIFDDKPALLYRQHTENLVGDSSSLKMKLQRLASVFQGRYKGWMEINLEALEHASTLLTHENLATVTQFSSLRRMKFPRRVLELHRSGVRRQNLSGNFGLYFACLLNLL